MKYLGQLFALSLFSVGCVSANHATQPLSVAPEPLLNKRLVLKDILVTEMQSFDLKRQRKDKYSRFTEVVGRSAPGFRDLSWRLAKSLQDRGYQQVSIQPLSRGDFQISVQLGPIVSADSSAQEIWRDIGFGLNILTLCLVPMYFEWDYSALAVVQIQDPTGKLLNKYQQQVFFEAWALWAAPDAEELHPNYQTMAEAMVPVLEKALLEAQKKAAQPRMALSHSRF